MQGMGRELQNPTQRMSFSLRHGRINHMGNWATAQGHQDSRGTKQPMYFLFKKIYMFHSDPVRTIWRSKHNAQTQRKRHQQNDQDEAAAVMQNDSWKKIESVEMRPL